MHDILFTMSNSYRQMPEPLTGISVQNSKQNAHHNGGGGRDRTDDLKLAKLPLSQLSYAPVYDTDDKKIGGPR